MTLDGLPVLNSTGITSLFSGEQDSIPFTLKNSTPVVVTIVKSAERLMDGFTYHCQVEGRLIPELNESIDLEAADAFEVGVPSLVTAGDGNVWYLLVTRSARTRATTSCHKRFRDFDDLNDAVRAALKGNHLLSSLPGLPPKGIKFFQDALFAEHRRQALDEYMKKLLRIPRVSFVSAVRDFIGYEAAGEGGAGAGGVREVSVAFGPGPLGLSLRAVASGRAGAALVTEFKALPDGGPSPAAASGVVGIGDVVSKVRLLESVGSPGTPARPTTTVAAPAVA